VVTQHCPTEPVLEIKRVNMT